MVLLHPWSAGCAPEAGITGVTAVSAKIAVWPVTRSLIMFEPISQVHVPGSLLAHHQDFQLPDITPLGITPLDL